MKFIIDDEPLQDKDIDKSNINEHNLKKVPEILLGTGRLAPGATMADFDSETRQEFHRELLLEIQKLDAKDLPQIITLVRNHLVLNLLNALQEHVNGDTILDKNLQQHELYYCEAAAILIRIVSKKNVEDYDPFFDGFAGDSVYKALLYQIDCIVREIDFEKVKVHQLPGLEILFQNKEALIKRIYDLALKNAHITAAKRETDDGAESFAILKALTALVVADRLIKDILTTFGQMDRFMNQYAPLSVTPLVPFTDGLIWLQEMKVDNLMNIYQNLNENFLEEHVMTEPDEDL